MKVTDGMMKEVRLGREMVTVVGIKKGFVARLDEHELIIQHIDTCLEMLLNANSTGDERTIVMNIAIRMFWPNSTYLGYKPLRGLVSSRENLQRSVFHSARFEVMTGK
jgi:hypothetical protein